jgi:hypothetical protein
VEVVIDLPHIRDTVPISKKLHEEGLPVKRRFRYLLVGADTEEAAIELGKRLESEVPRAATWGSGKPRRHATPTFVHLGSLKPGFLRDLGL